MISVRSQILEEEDRIALEDAFKRAFSSLVEKRDSRTPKGVPTEGAMYEACIHAVRASLVSLCLFVRVFMACAHAMCALPAKVFLCICLFVLRQHGCLAQSQMLYQHSHLYRHSQMLCCNSAHCMHKDFIRIVISHC